FQRAFHHSANIGTKRTDRPRPHHSAGINKASKNNRVQPEPASVPRDVFPRNEPTSIRLVPYIRHRAGHEYTGGSDTGCLDHLCWSPWSGSRLGTAAA